MTFDLPAALLAGLVAAVAMTTDADGEVRLLAPGLFAKNYGVMTPVGLVIGHVVYGLVVALVYSALV